MSKRSIAAFVIVLGVFCFIFTAKVAQAATNGTVTVPVLNVREGPGVGYNKITYIESKQTYPVITSQNGWYRLQIGSSSGWVCGDYITLSTTQEATTKPSTANNNQTPQAQSPQGSLKITTDLLNVRQGASTSSSKIGGVQMGETYQYFEKSGEWYKIKVSSSYGWVYGGYVAVVSQETAAPLPSLPSRSTAGEGGTSVVDSITANEDSINVKQNITFSAPSIGQLSKGTTYKVLETNSGWFKIQFGSETGWIRTNGVTVNYKTTNQIPDKSTTPVLNLLNEISDIRIYKTDSRNCVAIPLSLKVNKSSEVTALTPNISHSKSADGKIIVTVNNSVFSGTEKNSAASADNSLISSAVVTNLSSTANVVTIYPKGNIDYEISVVEGNSTADDQYRYLNTYIVINLKKAPSVSNVQTGPKNGQGKVKGNYLIALDAGHGGTTTGAVNGGYDEKTLNLDIIMKLNNILKAQGYDTYLTRDRDVYVSLSDRADGANILKADNFISVHLNSYGVKTVNGTETLYNSDAKVPGKQLADIIQRKLITALNRNDRGIEDRPDLAVLNLTYMPAALAEIMFISHQDELNLIVQDSTRQKTAQAIADAINEYFGFTK